MSTKWSGSLVWGMLFGIAAASRTALDWFVPTEDFSARSAVSTYVGISLLLGAGFWSAWRSGSFAAGLRTAVLAAVIGAAIDMAASAGMLALFHDALTMSAIEGSGGLGEVFTLPLMMVVPAFLLGALGGAVGAAANRKLRIDPA